MLITSCDGGGDVNLDKGIVGGVEDTDVVCILRSEVDFPIWSQYATHVFAITGSCNVKVREVLWLHGRVEDADKVCKVWNHVDLAIGSRNGTVKSAGEREWSVKSHDVIGRRGVLAAPTIEGCLDDTDDIVMVITTVWRKIHLVRGPSDAEASRESLQRVRPTGAHPPSTALPLASTHIECGRNIPKQVQVAYRVLRRGLFHIRW